MIPIHKLNTLLYFESIFKNCHVEPSKNFNILTGYCSCISSQSLLLPRLHYQGSLWCYRQLLVVSCVELVLGRHYGLHWSFDRGWLQDTLLPVDKPKMSSFCRLHGINWISEAMQGLWMSTYQRDRKWPMCWFPWMWCNNIPIILLITYWCTERNAFRMSVENYRSSR
jgi:hypothetical protein